MTNTSLSKWAQTACATCGMPVRVLFAGDRIVKVLAVCGHVKEPEADDG